MTTLKKDVVWSLAGNVMPLLAGLVLLPLILKTYGIDRLGLITLAWALIGYFSLFDLGLSRALTQLLSKLLVQKSSREDIHQLLVTSFAVVSLLGLCSGGVLFLTVKVLVIDFLHVSEELSTETIQSFSLIALFMPIVVHSSALRGVLEALEMFKVASVIRMLLGLGTFLAPWLASFYSTTLLSAVIALLMVRLFVWFFYFVQVRKTGLIVSQLNYFNMKWLKPLFSFGGWITVSNVIGPLMMYLDRFIIVSVLGVSSVALYVAPFEVVTKFLVIPAAIATVLFPFFAKQSLSINDACATKLNQGLLYSLILMYPICLSAIYFSSEWLRGWLGPAFALHSQHVVIWLVLGVLLNGISQVLLAKVQGFGRSDWTAKLHVLELFPYLALLYYGLKGWGIEGAAFAWFVRVLVDTAGLGFFVYKINAVNLSSCIKTLVTVVLSALSLSIVWWLPTFAFRVLFFTLLLSAYLIYLYNIAKQLVISPSTLLLSIKPTNGDK